jgi:hypothetical protein
MSLKNLKVGDTAYLRRFSKHLFMETKAAMEVSVKVIGTKYITIEHELLSEMVKFYRDTGYERCKCEPSFKLYASKQGIEEDIKRETFGLRLRQLDHEVVHALSLSQFHRIMAILEEDKAAEVQE